MRGSVMSHSHDLSSRHLLTRLAQTASLHAPHGRTDDDASSSSSNSSTEQPGIVTLPRRYNTAKLYRPIRQRVK